MIDKNKIIKNALLLLGSNNAYNDNKSDEYKIANTLLEKVGRYIIGDDDFLFSTITTKLTSIGQNKLGENRYNIPLDFERIIKADDCRVEGEFIYSKNSPLYIQYGRRIDITEYPNYIEELLTIGLAKELSMTFNSYVDRFQILSNQYEQEKRNVIYKLGYSSKKWGD